MKRTLLLALLVGCNRCGGGGSGPSPAATQTTADAAPSIPDYRATLKARGVNGRIFKAVGALGLNPEQKANLDKLGADLKKSEEHADAGVELDVELKHINDEMVAGVNAGKVDTVKIDAMIADSATANKARRAFEIETLNKVQRLLESPQRKIVVSSVRAAETKQAGKRPKARKNPKPGVPDAGEINWAKLRLESFTQGLELDAEQKKKVTEILAKEPMAIDVHEERAKAVEALLTAFDQDGFDANRFPVPDAQDKRAALLDLVRFVANITPILNAEQRKKLAARLATPDLSHKPHHGTPVNGKVRPPSDDDDLD